jgi:hypothetical protein
VDRPDEIRESVRRLLELLSDPEAQRDFERHVLDVHAPSEFVCRWFDDVHHPEDEAFLAAFSPEERAALAAFDEVYRAKEPELEPLPEDATALQALPAWGEIVRAAGDARKALRPA